MVGCRLWCALFLPAQSCSTSARSISLCPKEMVPSLSKIERNEQGVIASVPTVLSYVTPDTLAPFIRRQPNGVDGAYEGITWDKTEVNVYNARLESLELHQQGFQLVESNIPDDIDFYNMKDVVDRYYPICCDLLQNHLGEDVKVYAFDHNVRSNGSRRNLDNSNGALVQSPLGIVHTDYTHVSAPKRLQQLAQPPKTNDVHRQFLKDNESLLDASEVQQALKGQRRFAMANIWRNINRQSPVEQWPLACMDAQSTARDQLRTFSIYYEDRVGENYFAVHDQEQRWYYFPQMTHKECIILKQWDSSGSLVADPPPPTYLSSFAIHSAFEDPTSPEDPIPRESIEVRCVIIYPASCCDEENLL